MEIKNKKTGVHYTVSEGEWAGMHERQESRRYDVIDASDKNLLSEEIKVEPISLMDQGEVDHQHSMNDDLAEAPAENKYPFEDEDEEAEYLKEQIKGAGMYFHPNTGIVKLRKMYEEL